MEREVSLFCSEAVVSYRVDKRYGTGTQNESHLFASLCFASLSVASFHFVLLRFASCYFVLLRFASLCFLGAV